LNINNSNKSPQRPISIITQFCDQYKDDLCLCIIEFDNLSSESLRFFNGLIQYKNSIEKSFDFNQYQSYIKSDDYESSTEGIIVNGKGIIYVWLPVDLLPGTDVYLRFNCALSGKMNFISESTIYVRSLYVLSFSIIFSLSFLYYPLCIRFYLLAILTSMM
jgi:hypothetical protein